MINLRSPYFIKKAVANLTQMDVSISTYTGTRGTDEPAAQYTLSATAITPPTGAPYAIIDISEVARDYMESTFYNLYLCTNVWVAYQITTYISGVAQTPEAVVRLGGFDGYNYFEEGYRGNTATHNVPDVLQSNSIIYRKYGETMRVPVSQTNVTSVQFKYEGAIVDTDTITSIVSESTDMIQYATCTTLNCDQVVVNGLISYQIPVVTIEDCKYTSQKIVFINKFGALQDLWFFGSSTSSISTSSETYKANIIDYNLYSTSTHHKKILDKNASETISINSGWYPEEYNEVFRQLHLSEKVWAIVDNVALPVNVSDNGMEFKTKLNDKLINNSVTFEFAFDKLNNIR